MKEREIKREKATPEIPDILLTLCTVQIAERGGGGRNSFKDGAVE